MPKKIIILDRVGEPSDIAYRVAFWIEVPQSRWKFYVKSAEFKSQWLDASDAENQDLRDGKIEEIIETHYLPAGATVAQVRNFLENRYRQLQDWMNNTNPYHRYGSYWDGTQWVVGGV